MSETPPAGHPSAPGPAGLPPGLRPAAPFPPGSISPPRGPKRWPMYVMLLVTLVAVGASVILWFHSTRDTKAITTPTPAYGEQQVADAKSKVCSAFENVW